jgi:uncharacterized membrane protein YoaK (UPF0700 family)
LSDQQLLKTKQRRMISESFRLGALLALVGGFLDAYSYMTRGEVFATAETGNIVLMGLNLSRGNFPMVLHYLLPICVYAVGIIVVKTIQENANQHHLIVVHWRQIVIFCEACVLMCVYFIPQTPHANLLANVLIAFVSSMQVQSFRKLRGLGFATTMCTGNLRSAMDRLYSGLSKGTNRQEIMNGFRYLGIIASFVAGVIISYQLTLRWSTHAMPFAVCILIVVFVLLVREPREFE